MKTKKVKITELKSNPSNPRFIKGEKFAKLVQSIKDFPEMLNARPIVVNKDMVVLGGNMRLRACIEAGIKDLTIVVAEGFTEAQEREFIIKDNVSFGDWDWSVIVTEWVNEDLNAWGIDAVGLQSVSGFEPEVMPKFDVHEVTKDEVEARAKVLAAQMVQEYSKIEVICPKCAHEFEFIQ